MQLILSVTGGLVRDALGAVFAEAGADVSAPERLVDIQRLLADQPGAVLVANQVPDVGTCWAGGRRVVALDGLSDVERQAMHEAGAEVVVPSDRSLDAIVAAVREPDAAAPDVVSIDAQARPARRLLTPREVEVVRLISKGLTGGEIAEALGVRPKTVENHKQRMFAKLDVQNQAHAVARCARLGFLDRESVALAS